MASMLPFSWNTGSWSSGSVWLMVGVQRLVTKSAETYNEIVPGPQAGSNDVECAAHVFVEAVMDRPRFRAAFFHPRFWLLRSEEHTSELQSLMRISYAVFCLKKQTQNHIDTTYYLIVL